MPWGVVTWNFCPLRAIVPEAFTLALLIWKAAVTPPVWFTTVATLSNTALAVCPVAVCRVSSRTAITNPIRFIFLTLLYI